MTTLFLQFVLPEPAIETSWETALSFLNHILDAHEVMKANEVMSYIVEKSVSEALSTGYRSRRSPSLILRPTGEAR